MSAIDKDSPAVQLRDKMLQEELGTELKAIARWYGQRMAVGDTISIRILQDYLRIVLGATLEPPKIAVVLEGEEVEAEDETIH